MPQPNQISKLLKDSLTGDLESIWQHKANHPEFHWVEVKYPKTGDTVLHMAARNGYIPMIEYLLTSFEPRSTNCRNNDNKTSLHEAAQFCQYYSTETLLKFGADVNALKKADWTPLMLACTKLQDGSLRLVRLLLENGALVNYRNKDGWTALHLACREGNVDILNLLLDHDADIKIKTRNGRAPLHIAALHGNLDVVRALCTRNVDVNERDSCGSVPVHEAILGNHVDVCKELISKRADVRCRNSAGFSLVHLAASQSRLEVIEYVLDELGFDVNEPTEKQFMPLHCAARKNREDVYGFLLGRGATENAQDSLGRLAKEYFALEPV